MKSEIVFSIVILTFNRRHRVEQQIQKLSLLTLPGVEIIVVDNCSEESVDDLVKQDPRARVIRNTQNLGAVGRNVGMKQALGQYVITLDDDVYGITDENLDSIKQIFDNDEWVAAINFTVLEEGTHRITDWCHPRDMTVYSQEEFQTNDISEGAVAFRKGALEKVGYYPSNFFISHEGPDLAFRLINAKFKVLYSPKVSVFHSYEQQGRASWRRYYFDTRNQLWLAIRNYTFSYGVKQVLLAWGSVMVYAIRDGFFRYWLKGIYDAVKGCPQAFKERISPTPEAVLKWQEIEKYRPSFWVRLKKRLFSDVVRG